MKFKILLVLIIIVLFILLQKTKSTNQNGKIDSDNIEHSKLIIEPVYEYQKYTPRQDTIIGISITNAYKYRLFSENFQKELDKGLVQDSTISFLWQQKAMALYKARKYELGLPFLDKAVKYNRIEYQPYRAFMKCIFSKTYREAIIDFTECKRLFGNLYEMDHTYNFYIAISHLQLNEFDEAENIFRNEIDSILVEKEAHFIDLLYYGITLLELKKYTKAIEILDKSILQYPQFSEAIFYKSICLKELGFLKEAKKLNLIAIDYAKKGYTINEDNTAYELYPYQIRWE